MARVIQISVTEEQYHELTKRAGRTSIQHYIIGREFPENEFERWFPELLERVKRIEPRTQFNVKAVFGTDWVNISKGIKLSLGRVFYQHVAANRVLDANGVPHVRAIEPDKARTQWYEIIPTNPKE